MWGGIGPAEHDRERGRGGRQGEVMPGVGVGIGVEVEVGNEGECLVAAGKEDADGGLEARDRWASSLTSTE